MLATEENGPRDPAGVLALEEKRLGLSVEETEGLGVTTDVDLATAGVDLATCKTIPSAFQRLQFPLPPRAAAFVSDWFRRLNVAREEEELEWWFRTRKGIKFDL